MQVDRLSRRACLSFVAATLFLSSSVVAEDWPQWRGPNRDGLSKETGLLKEWPEGGPAMQWKADGLGEGYSSVAVANGYVYTLGDLEDGCYLIALSDDDGQIAWKTKIGERGGHKRYKGPRSTPTVDGDQIFTLNQHGTIACVQREGGDLLWSVELEDDLGGKMMSGWRYSESPLVDGNKVICTPGGNKGTVVALDRKSGETLWRTTEWTDTAAYSSVIVATIHGKRQYVQLTGRSVAGIEPDTGKLIWKADREGKTAVVATPVVSGDIVFVTSSYGVGCNGFRIGSDWSTEEIYASKAIANHHGGVLLLGDHVFGSSGGTFRCLEIESGELNFNARSIGKGATVYADGHFYLRSESGPIALIKATTDDMIEVSHFDQPSRTDERAWAHPVIANGKMYLRDQSVLLVYDVKSR